MRPGQRSLRGLRVEARDRRLSCGRVWSVRRTVNTVGSNMDVLKWPCSRSPDAYGSSCRGRRPRTASGRCQVPWIDWSEPAPFLSAQRGDVAIEELGRWRAAHPTDRSSEGTPNGIGAMPTTSAVSPAAADRLRQRLPHLADLTIARRAAFLAEGSSPACASRSRGEAKQLGRARDLAEQAVKLNNAG